MAITIRPMEATDAAEVQAMSWAALEPLFPGGPPQDAVTAARAQTRLRHLVSSDPDGAWVAEEGGEIVGTAIAIVRERLWGLSLLAVAPSHQGRGTGVRLLGHALEHGDPDAARMILSSTDPRALRAYHRAGLRAHPALQATGPANRSRIPAGLRSVPGDPDADADTIDRASRHVRGASHLPDVPAALDAGCELLVCEDRGFALMRDGSPYLLAALDDDTAQDLLWSCLALAAPGETVYVCHITAGNDWALTVALDAGLSLSPDGPVFARRVRGTMAPFLPSGAYL